MQMNIYCRRMIRVIGYIRKIILLCCTLAISCCISGCFVSAKTTGNDSTRTVRVGYYITPGFQEYDSDTGEYSGYSYEYMMAIKQYTNWRYEFVPVEFADGVDMLEKGELDLLNNVSITADRKKVLGFSKYESGTNYACLMTKSDNKTYAYNDFGDFDGIKVGLLHRSIFNKEFKELYTQNGFEPDILYYDTSDDVDKALMDGEIDARVVSSSYNMENMRIIAKFSPMEYYFAMPKNEKKLYRELNYAMECIREDQPGLDKTLEDKYYNRLKEEDAVLSDAEKQYISKHAEIKVACTRSWYPISYFDNEDRYVGPLAVIYAKISEATGLKFRYVPYDNYTDALNSFKSGKTEMLCEMPQDYIFANKYDANITNPVASIGIYRVTKNGGLPVDAMRKVAILKNTYIGLIAERMFDSKTTEFISYDTTDECVNAVNAGEVDCTFMNSYQSYYYQSQGKYLQMKYVLISDMQYELSLAITRGAQGITLKSIIVKGLSTISEEELQQLFQDIHGEDSSRQDLEVLFYKNPILVVFCSILAAIIMVISLSFVVYSRNMRKKNIELYTAKQQESIFLSRMSHDIRTPLNGIIGMTKIALSDADSIDEYRECVEKIDSSGQYLTELVNNILDFKKIESDNLELKLEPYSLNELKRHISAVIKPLCDEKGVVFCMGDMELTNGMIMADKIRLNQIIINLLSNAVKYTPKGGSVSIKDENTKLVNGKVYADVVISDTGIGMSDEFQQHMFESFTQENTTTAAAGSGLGLAIVKQLVDKMHGNIEVFSSRGNGTKVTVHFVFDYAQSEEKSEIKEDYDEYFLKGKRILLCEDHSMNAEIARRLLERKNAEVIIAENGKIGLEKFVSSEIGYYDLIFMDIRMPQMGGIEATKSIRQLNRADARKIPIVAMTADAYDTDREKTRAAGMNAHLSKPIDVNEMYHTIYSVLH